MTQFGSYRESIEIIKALPEKWYKSNIIDLFVVDKICQELEKAETKAIADFEADSQRRIDETVKHALSFSPDEIDIAGSSGDFEGTKEDYNKTVSQHDQ